MYIRLSRDDGNDESLSVVNQKKIILDYLAHSFAGGYFVAGVYVDDGLTGTDYDRPDFLRLLRDIESGAVNCVVCKNLSRAFRNYADQGYFLESYFPLHGTRFVSIGDPKVDSYLFPETIQNLEVPITGLLNDRYACKTSADVRATFDIKRRNGEFIGAFAPYGYKKDPGDKNRLIVDEEAARVVREVFRWFVYGGVSKNGIVRRLNALGVPNPTEYKRRQGFRYHNSQGGGGDGLWSAGTIARMLKNPVYIGTMVQGRQRVISYKVHDRVAVPEGEWFVMADTHEAIVEREIFDKAQALQRRDARTPPNRGDLHLFAGFLRCADCDKALTRKTSKGYVYYCCRTHREKSATKCAKHAIREDALKSAVLAALQRQIALVGAPDEIAAAVDAAPAAPGAAKRLDKALERHRQEHEKLKAAMDGLYPDWKNGDITREEYHRLKAKLGRQAAQLVQVIRALQAETLPPARGQTPAEASLACFLKTGGIDRLDRGILTALVDTIYVRADGGIRIELNFADPRGRADGRDKSGGNAAARDGGR